MFFIERRPYINGIMNATNVAAIFGANIMIPKRLLGGIFRDPQGHATR